MRFNSIILVASILATPMAAQRPNATAPASDRDTTAKAATPIPNEASSATDHTIRIGGQLVPYRATAATMLLKNDKDEPIGVLYYTAYTRTDSKDASQRPIAFIYNGGPGSASAWLHMGAFGPRRIMTTDAAFTPPPPYQIVDNQSSLIDVTDMVFIDPVGTGFSKPVGKGTGKDFWGVDEDAKALAQFISQYVSRNGRWASPKYLIGESYGATRAADRKAAAAKQVAAYTGLSEDYLMKADLRVPLRQFMAELQRSRGLVTGRLDSRFSGPLPDLLSENAPGDPQSSAVTGAFTAAVNAYLRGELKFDTPDRYLLGGGNQGQWNWTREGSP